MTYELVRTSTFKVKNSSRQPSCPSLSLPMKSAPQPVSLVVRRRLTLQFLSYFRPPDFRNSPDPPLFVTSASPVKGLPAAHYPRLTFRMNTCKSVSKQSTLTTFRINTYEKQGEGGPHKNRRFSRIYRESRAATCFPARGFYREESLGRQFRWP
jgi:hypothetical protein